MVPGLLRMLPLHFDIVAYIVLLAPLLSHQPTYVNHYMHVNDMTIRQLYLEYVSPESKR